MTKKLTTLGAAHANDAVENQGQAGAFDPDSPLSAEELAAAFGFAGDAEVIRNLQRQIREAKPWTRPPLRVVE